MRANHRHLPEPGRARKQQAGGQKVRKPSQLLQILPPLQQALLPQEQRHERQVNDLMLGNAPAVQRLRSVCHPLEAILHPANDGPLLGHLRGFAILFQVQQRRHDFEI